MNAEEMNALIQDRVDEGIREAKLTREIGFQHAEKYRAQRDEARSFARRFWSKARSEQKTTLAEDAFVASWGEE